MTASRIHKPFALAALTLLPLGAIAGSVKTAATITFASGPNAGQYSLEAESPCRITALASGDPTGFRASVRTEAQSKGGLRDKPKDLGSLDITIPRIDSSAHLGEVQINVVFGDPGSRRTPGKAYSVDTVPPDATPGQKDLDALLKRGGMARKQSGKGGAKLADHGASATLDFWGETSGGVSFKGTFDCRRVSRE